MSLGGTHGFYLLLRECLQLFFYLFLGMLLIMKKIIEFTDI